MAPVPSFSAFAPPSAGSPFSFAPSKTSTPQPSSSKSAFNTPAPARQSQATSSAMDLDRAASGSGPSEDDVEALHLNPGAYPPGGRAKWSATGRTVGAAVSPVGGEVAVWVTNKPSDDPNKPPKLADPKPALADGAIYFTSLHTLPAPLVNLYSESHLLFTSLQEIMAESTRVGLPSIGFGGDGILGQPDAEAVSNMRRLAEHYVFELDQLKSWSETDPVLRERFTDAFNTFNLAEILYLPVDGKGEGLVGEELLDWVNEVDIAPDNHLGNEIMSTRSPWDHPSFWPFIARSILRGFHLPAASFLATLANHPHQPIVKLASILEHNLTVFPRSHETRWRVDLDFLQAHRSWLASFRAEFAGWLAGRKRGSWLDDGSGADEVGGKDGLKAWENDFRSVVELMEGKPERVLEESADWREALGAWGVLVDVDMRRDHLPSTMALILDKIPVDTTLPDHVIHAALCSGDIIKALMGCYDLDLWLAAHLGDLLDKLQLIPDDEDRFDLSLRDYFLLEYVEVLQNNTKHAAFWRMACDYLNAAGEEGRNRLKAHILRVAIPLERDLKGKGKQAEPSAPEADGMDVEGDAPAPGEGSEAETKGMGSEAIKLLDEVRVVCTEFRLEKEWIEISTVLATRLITLGSYGAAASLSVMAGDGYTVSRIAECIMNVYIEDGPEAFLEFVDDLPPSLLAEAPSALAELQQSPSSHLPGNPFPPAHSHTTVLASRIAFLADLRDYLLYVAQGAKLQAADKLVGLLTGGVSPVGLWGVLLLESVELLEDPEIVITSRDTSELLRILEDVLAHATYADEMYLGPAAVYLLRVDPAAGKKGDLGEVRRKLEEVRLALGRNLARALVAGFDEAF
ncbi:hypothetical protein IAT38_000622 [Cryptococcus sp. DSM 104549]